MQVKYNMVVDFARPNKSNTVLIAENDANSRNCYFTLLFDKAPFDMTGVTTATVLGITSSGQRIYGDATIIQDEEGNNTNQLSYLIPLAITENAGNVTMTVTLTDNVGARITSFEFFIKVRNALYNEDDYIDEDDMAGFRDLLARTRAALERMEQMVQQDALPNPYPIRITVDGVEYEYNGENLVEILMGNVAYLGPTSGTVEITEDDSAAERAAESAREAAESASSAGQSVIDMTNLLNNFDSQIPTATVTKNIATRQSVIVITDKNGTTSAVVEDGIAGNKWYSGMDLSGTGTGLTGAEGYEGDFYVNPYLRKIYTCTLTGDSESALWDYLLTMGSDTFKTVQVSGTSVEAFGEDTLQLIAGSNITIIPNASNKTLTISSTGCGAGGGGGDMLQSVYDTDRDGCVNKADTLDGLTATVTELNYVHGVTSDLQTQISNKAAAIHTHTMSQITDLDIPDELADLTDDSTHRVVTDAQISACDGKQIALIAGSGISLAQDGTISATLASTKGYKTVKVGNTDINATTAEDFISLVAGSNITLTPDASNKTVTITSTGGGAGGGGGDMLQSVYDKNKNGIVDKAETLSDGTTDLTASISELNYVKDVTGPIQTQFAGKADSVHTHTKSQITDFPAIPSTLAELAADSTHRVVTDTQIGAWNAKQAALIVGSGIDITNNVISATASTKKGYKTVKVGSTDIDAAEAEDFISLLAGSNISITPDATNKTIEISLDGGGIGGHNMLPTPSSSIIESDVVDAVKGGITEGGINDDVASLYGVGKWSNTMTKTFEIKGKAGSSTRITQSGIGTWPADPQNPTAAELETWIPIRELYGIWSSGDDVHFKLGFHLETVSVPITLGGYYIDDNCTMSDGQGGTIPCGRIVIKFGNEIPEADTHTAVISVEMTIKRTDIIEVG